MTITEDRTTVTDGQQAAFDRIDEAIDGLRALRELIADRPDIADSVRLRSHDINVFVGDHLGDGKDVPDRIASLAYEAALHGGIVSQRHNGEYGGIEAMFGPFPLHVYARISQVGTATTHMVEVTDWQPHPAIANIGGGAK